MVLINGKEFKVYELDTAESILNRLAIEQNTLPKYLYFPEGIPTLYTLQSSRNIPLINLVEKMKEPRLSNITFKPYYDFVKDKLEQQKLSLKEDIFPLFVAMNPVLNETDPEYTGFLLLNMTSSMSENKYFNPPYPSPDILWKNRKETIARYQRIVNILSNKTVSQYRMLQIYEEVEEGIEVTKFNLEKTVFDMDLSIKNVTILEIFNKLNLSIGVPFTTINNFFKIMKGFTPPEEWAYTGTDAIITKVLQKKNAQEAAFEDYVDTVMVVEGDPGNQIVRASMELDSTGSNLDKEMFIQRFLDTIRGGFSNVEARNVEETSISGIFYLPGQEMNRYVMSDMVMNNELFANIFTIDESDKATKKKTGLFIRVNMPMMGSVSMNLIEKVVEATDYTLKGQNKKLFPINSKYIRVKVTKATNERAVNKLREMLSKLFVIYNESYEGIVQFYRRYITDFAEEDEEKQDVFQVRRIKDTDWYAPGYTRRCSAPPTIISPEEAEEAIDEGIPVMEFPREEDGIPLSYRCDYDTKIYPGLRENPFETKDRFPYIPCCYPEDQKDKEGSYYRNYFYNEELREKMQSKSKKMLITNKILSEDVFSPLPLEYIRLFDAFDQNIKYGYWRKGVTRSKTSFLQCVMEALNINDILSLNSSEEKLASAVMERMSLATPEIAAACRQEMSGYTSDEIMAMIEDTDVFLDPRNFVNLAQIKYKCNVYIFLREGDKFRMVVPNHNKAYYTYRNDFPSILIYQHMGSESDFAKYPQCELIIRSNSAREDEHDYNFSYDSKTSKGLRKIFRKMKLAYNLDVPINETVFPWNTSVSILGQSIDPYGKTRSFTAEFRGKKFLLMTEPIAPINAKEVPDEVEKISLNDAVKIFETLEVEMKGQVVSDSIVVEVRGILGNVDVIIPTTDSNPVEGITVIYDNPSYAQDKSSELENFNKFRKLSRYVTEYMFWLYSKYLQGMNKTVMDQESVTQFSDQYIEIDPEFIYEDVVNSFVEDNPALMSDGRLIVKSEETLRRLLYVLRVEIARNGPKLLKYYMRTAIERYYEDVSDFDPKSNQVILEGEKSVEKWIMEMRNSYFLYESVIPGTLNPYFFRNDIISENIVWIMQPVDSIQTAVTTAITWEEKGYNEYDPEFEQEIPSSYTLYSYASPKDIVPYKVAGAENQYDIRILGYKYEGISYYTVMLRV